LIFLRNTQYAIRNTQYVEKVVKSSIYIFLLITLLFIPLASAQPEEKTYKVTRVVDGDTLILNGHERVRLIGVDTPEVHPTEKLRRSSIKSGKPVRMIARMGKKASQFTKKHIYKKKVRLDFDWQKKDKYGRTLAYVYREPDGFFLNAEIIKQGYGHAYTRFPFKYLEDFRQYQRDAREQKLGLWADNSLEGL
jgi:micrococcal nuclease